MVNLVDEVQRLHSNKGLRLLLAHYVELSEENQETWHDRLTEFDNIQGRDLTKLYGELIAHGWIEQNTGSTPILEPGRHAGCYRVTPSGLRVFKGLKKQEKAKKKLASVN